MSGNPHCPYQLYTEVVKCGMKACDFTLDGTAIETFLPCPSLPATAPQHTALWAFNCLSYYYNFLIVFQVNYVYKENAAFFGSIIPMLDFLEKFCTIKK